MIRGLFGAYIPAEVEAGADGVAEGPSAVREDVVEGVVVDEVHLRAQAYVFAERVVAATTDAVEAGPVEFVASGRESGDDHLLEGIGRVGNGSLAQAAERGAEEERQ